MAPKKRKKRKASSNTQLDPFAVGGVVALSKAGYIERQIFDSNAVQKPDGSSIEFAKIGKILRHVKDEPGWRGERNTGTVQPHVGPGLPGLPGLVFLLINKRFLSSFIGKRVRGVRASCVQ